MSTPELSGAPYVQSLNGDPSAATGARKGQPESAALARLLALPSCEVLEVTRAGDEPDLLVPLVRDAVRDVDLDARVIDVDLGFLGEA